MSQKNQEGAIAFIRIDLGIEHWEEGRDVVDIFGTHVIVANASFGELKVGYSTIDEEKISEIAKHIEVLMEKCKTDEPLDLKPDECAVILTLAYYENRISSIEIPFSKFATTRQGKEILDQIQRWKKSTEMSKD